MEILPPTDPKMSQSINQNLRNSIEDAKAEINSANAKKSRGRPKKEEIKDRQKEQLNEQKLIYKDQFKALVLFSGKFLASGSKFQGFEFSNEEAELLGAQASEVAVEFAPMLESKYVKLGMFAALTCSMYGSKYALYTAYQKELAKKEKENAQNIAQTQDNNYRT